MVLNGRVEAADYLHTVDVNGSCSGVLLRNDWVITCNHCFGYDVDDHPEAIVVFYGGYRNDPNRQRSRVARLVRHPTNTPGLNPLVESPSDGTQGFDLALLHLAEPFRVGGTTDGFKRELWPSARVGELAGLALTVVGWGFQSVNPVVVSNEPRSCVLRPRTFRRNLVYEGVPRGDLLGLAANAAGQMTLPGDSGCGYFVNVGGEDYLAALNLGGGSEFLPANPGLFAALTMTHIDVYQWLTTVLDPDTSDARFHRNFARIGSNTDAAPCVASSDGLSLDVLVTNRQQQVERAHWAGPGSAWTPFSPIGVASVGPPCLVALPGSPFFFGLARTPNSQIMLFLLSDLLLPFSTAALPVALVPGTATSAPSACLAGGRLHMVVRNVAGRVEHRVVASTTIWGPASDLGRECVGEPAITADAAGRELLCAIRERDGRLSVRRRRLQFQWDRWQTVDGVMTSSPAVVGVGGSSYLVFARGLRNQLIMLEIVEGEPLAWKDVGNQVMDTPATTRRGSTIDVVTRGVGSDLYHRWTG